MRKRILLTLLYVPFIVFGQSHSWDGKGINPKEKLHYLNIFVNIIYDVHPDANNTFNNPDLYWPTITDPSLEGINTAAIPTYLLDWMDTVYVPGQLHGTCTRLYGESSFDSLQITGDFVVVNIKESTILSHGPFKYYTIRDVAMDMLSQSNSFTLFGHHNLTDFNAKNVLIRNITKNYGELNPGSGYGGRNTIQCVGDGDLSTNPTCIVTHEISHGLFGGNAFHTSGGNHRYPDNTVMSFLNLQGGYGLMGAAHSGLVCCNGYERWRMHWKHPQSVDFISARDISNTQSVVSDITKESGNRNFILRDFVTYGDAVRIKLPYKDSVTSSNQYIWLENHQVGSNVKLDFLQYSNIDYNVYCRPRGAAGIYAYYQIGRDVLEGTGNEVWDSFDRDNLRIIPAEGYYDFELIADSYNVNCVSNENQTYAYRRGTQNPLCGGQDQEFQLFPLETDNVLYLSRELEPWRKVVDNQNYDCLPFLGDTLDAFRTHAKINMGTNPSTNNVKTFHSNNHNPSDIISAMCPEKNVQTTYLTGLSIEMTPIQGTGNILVNILWDDYSITNDTRWTGKIALKETAILTAGKTITLAQNRTVAQPTRDPETGLFAGRTRWTCENGSFFRQDSASVLRLTENSSVVFNAGSRYELTKGARLEIKAGCTLSVLQGAKVQLKGTVEVDSGGVLILYDTAKMGALARLIVRPGGKLVVDGGTLTSACPGEMWQGIEVVGDRTKQQHSQYQGMVELKNGATIENAHCGIRTGLREDTVTYATTGGIILAMDAHFHNNRRAVEINSYAHTDLSGNIENYYASFSRCSFTVDNSNLFAANNTAFAEHVRMWDVKGVAFDGCSFRNSTSTPYSNGRGIYAEDAGFQVNTFCRPQVTFECECPENDATPSVFTGFTKAIEINTTGNPYAVTVDGASFIDNVTGVCLRGNNYATVTRCTFNLDQWFGHAGGNNGLCLDNCSAYKVEENTFERTSYPTGLFYIDNSTGITVSNTGFSSNSLYLNIFRNLTKGVSVSGANGHPRLGGLQLSCNHFNGGKYDIYLNSGASIAYIQGSATKGANNVFDNTTQNISNLYNPNALNITYYYYGSGTNLEPVHRTGVVPNPINYETGCASTLCDHNGDGGSMSLAGFQSGMNAYTTALAENNNNDNLDNTDNNNSTNLPTNASALLAGMRQSLSETYYEAVRALMSDTVLDLSQLEQWHAAAQPIADPYSLTETRFMEGYAETFAGNAENAEMANYAEFHAMKLALRNQNDNLDNQDNNNSSNLPNSPAEYSPSINWYALTPAQIAQLQTIAERNTGRASVMAKGVLCFFFGICYDDEVFVNDNLDNQDNQGDPETRSAKAVQPVDDTNLSVYPNPTDDFLYIELTGAGIANVALYDLQGRAVYSQNSSNSPVATINMQNIPAGVYVLHVTDGDGKEYRQKVVRR